ncbi:MAG: sulfur carrier protein ThiS [Paludibacter sp.]|nr:sulfur carrier protein ThiS [Paludibacter sp.]MBP7611731.1 sulfur carrier protein ThiS [Paludibacter sp.]
MNIQINSEQKNVPDGTTVHECVLNILQLDPAGKAIAVNETIVPNHLWETTLLQEKDRMLVIKACSGG